MTAVIMFYYVTVDAASVIVIGGGASGLAAGATLLSAGYDVTVLEANSKLGGRMSPRHLVTDDPTSPIVEQGANWIHGYKSNYVLWPLATKLGMHGAHTNYSDNPGPQDPTAPRAIYMVSTCNIDMQYSQSNIDRSCRRKCIYLCIMHAFPSCIHVCVSLPLPH
jgi:hypothetical protein